MFEPVATPGVVGDKIPQYLITSLPDYRAAVPGAVSSPGAAIPVYLGYTYSSPLLYPHFACSVCLQALQMFLKFSLRGVGGVGSCGGARRMLLSVGCQLGVI